MKNIFSILKYLRKLVLIPVILLILVISSCEDIIELQPYNNVSETIAFSTPSLIALSVTGMYEAAQIGYYRNPVDPAYRGYPFGAAFVEQGDCRGEDVVNMQAFYSTPTRGHTTLQQPITGLLGRYLQADQPRKIS